MNLNILKIDWNVQTVESVWRTVRGSREKPECFSSPVSVVSDLCGGVGGGDEQVDHARLQLLQTEKHHCIRRHQWPPEWLTITLNDMIIPDTSLWWCHRTRPLRRQRPLPPVWPSRPSRAAGDPTRSASRPDERSARRWVYTSDPCAQLQTNTGRKNTEL